MNHTMSGGPREAKGSPHRRKRPKMRLAEALEKFLQEPRRATTEVSYQKVLVKHIEYLGPERDVRSITLDDINNWARSLMQQQWRYKTHKRRKPEKGKLSDHTIYKHLKTARVFWNWLQEHSIIPASPMNGLKISRPPKPDVSSRTAPKSTLAALIRVMRRNSRDWAMFCFLVDTGVRANSLCELRMSMLDLDRNEAHLPQKGGRAHVAVFGPVTAKALKAFLKDRPKVEFPEVFLNQDGKPWTSDSLRSWLYRRCKQAGVRPIGPHALRRAVGCHLSLMQVPLSLVSKHLGHSNPMITATHYMPDDTEALHDMLERFGLLRELNAGNDEGEQEGRDVEPTVP